MCCVACKVGFRCFLTGVHNKQLYPTFTRAVGRASIQYATIMEAITNKFGFRKLVIVVEHHDQSAMEMVGYISTALRSTGTDAEVVEKIVHGSTEARYQLMKKLKEEDIDIGNF